MRVLYIPRTPFGEFFFDPESLQGVGLGDDGFLVVGMDKGYDPRTQPGYKELDVPDGTFGELKNSALMYESARGGLLRALCHFPSNPNRPMPGLMVGQSRVGAVGEYIDPNILSMPVEQAFERTYSLYRRAINRFENFHHDGGREIRTLCDLRYVTEHELLSMRGLGEVTLEYIKRQLARYGIRLSGEPKPSSGCQE